MKTKENIDMLRHERDAEAQGYRRICGVDEVGYGPWAGPVYSCAVVLPDGFEMEGLTDSKKISEKKREALFEPLCQSVEYALGICSVEEIEQMGPGAARWESMRRAVEALHEAPDYVLVDGNHFPAQLAYPGAYLVKGDQLSLSIAAASVIAKVSRDRLMCSLAKQYPQYHFEAHKGYGTKAHAQAIIEHGPCPIHRSQYIRNVLKK